MSQLTDPGRPAQPSRTVWPLRDRPAVAWLVLAAIVALVHRSVPASTWLMIHLVMLGALTHSAMVWSTHFTQALLKTRPGLDDRRTQSRRLWLLLLGTTLVLVGVPTATWPVTVAGATLVSAAVGWHAVQLVRRLRAALPGRFRISVRYYVAAALLVVLGAGLGATLARGLDDEMQGRILLAHSLTMVLGWIGLTMTGTLVTLWPTMLRTRIDGQAERLATQALPILLGGLLVAVGGALVGLRIALLAGLAGYLVGLIWWGRALLAPARSAPPRRFATLSVTAAVGWFVVAIATVATMAARDSWTDIGRGYGAVGAIVVVGFGAQLLTGALSTLMPTVLGGGPSVVRAAEGQLERWSGARLVMVNLGLLICLLPVPSAVRVAVSAVVLLGLVMFIPLVFTAIRASRAARLAPTAGASSRPPARPTAPRVRSGQVVAGAVAVLLATTIGIGADPSAAGLAGFGATTSSAGTAGDAVTPTGHTTTVAVSAKDMRFSPATISVPRGDRLVITLTNNDPTTTHDLVLANGKRTARLSPGATATLDAGVIGSSMAGWCSVVGHRQMGMVLAIDVTGGSASAAGQAGASDAHTGHGTTGDATAPDHIDLTAAFGAGFEPVDPSLPPAPADRTHAVTLTVRDVDLEVAPGVWQKRWTFNGAVPGPTLHGRVGDTFVVTLVNDGSMGHSVDFHAGDVSPDEPMRTIPPGASLTYRFTAKRAGIWMYHCSTMPMSVHIAAGLFGAVVIDPPDLPAADVNYVLVQSEVYLGANRAEGSADEVDATAVAAEQPNLVTFNGVAAQYDQAPLKAVVGQRVRIWVLDAGPNRATSFHVVGGQFDTVYSEGAWLLGGPGAKTGGGSSGGSQALGLMPAQGGFVELVFTEPGRYSIVSHVMVDAERGAHGYIDVTAH